MHAYITLHKYDNKFYEINQIKNEGSPLLAQNEVRADIFLYGGRNYPRTTFLYLALKWKRKGRFQVFLWRL
jgi:hypothetical protein